MSCGSVRTSTHLICRDDVDENRMHLSADTHGNPHDDDDDEDSVSYIGYIYHQLIT